MAKANPGKRFTVRLARRCVQVISLAFFLYLFLMSAGVVDKATGMMRLISPAPVDTYLRANPLLTATTMIAARDFSVVLALWAFPVIVLTLLLGRVFCGWLCPLGVVIDASDRVFFKKTKQSCRPIDKRLKYYLLAALAATAVFSAQAVYLFDPIALLTRTLVLSIYAPLQMAAGSMIPGIAYGGIFHETQVFYRQNILVFTIFLGILGLGIFARRHWCRSLCPLGALLGIISRVSILRRICKEGCIQCGACIKECKTGAIHDNPAIYDTAECIYCYNCTDICPAHVLEIPIGGQTSGCCRDLNLNRRRIIQGFGIGIAWALLSKTNASAKYARASKVKLSSPQLIRPPGAAVEDKFLAKCIRCGECMKICPTGGLQPAVTEAGIEGFWSPVLVPKVGECTQKCNLCSKVCPTGAIERFEIDDKSEIFIGTAAIDRSQCIVWALGKRCLVCKEVCSYNAVYTEMADGVPVPMVNEQICVGCGICENNCPVHPVSAIRVYSFGDRRHKRKTKKEEPM